MKEKFSLIFRVLNRPTTDKKANKIASLHTAKRVWKGSDGHRRQVPFSTARWPA
jgi:hypothetical protein